MPHQTIEYWAVFFCKLRNHKMQQRRRGHLLWTMQHSMMVKQTYIFHLWFVFQIRGLRSKNDIWFLMDGRSYVVVRTTISNHMPRATPHIRQFFLAMLTSRYFGNREFPNLRFQKRKLSDPFYFYFPLQILVSKIPGQISLRMRWPFEVLPFLLHRILKSPTNFRSFTGEQKQRFFLILSKFLFKTQSGCF